MQDALRPQSAAAGELIQQCETQDPDEAVKHVIKLRDQINEGFNAVKAQADAVVFEFGPTRQRKLKIRDDIRRWQPTLGILLQVQITYLQYLFQMQSADFAAAGRWMRRTRSKKTWPASARSMSDEVSGKVPPAPPDIQASAAKLRDVIHQQYAQSGGAVPPSLTDMITLTQNLASIVAPLYVDIHATFVERPADCRCSRTELRPGEA